MKSFNPTAVGIASIIVPCHDQLSFTRHCLAALMRHTRPPWELILVDNGSADGTPAYLQGVQDAAAVPVVVLTNPTNLGFPAACNQALTRARGDYLVLLNNDVVVTDAWLAQLIALAESDPKIGLVGPMSNYASPPQLVEAVPYQDLDAMHRFAGQWRERHRGQWITTRKLSGFCLLIKRAAYRSLGDVEERSGSSEVDDLVFGGRAGGYGLAVAYDLFVHKQGGRTSTEVGGDLAISSRRSELEVVAGREPIIDQSVAVVAGPSGSSCVRERPRVSLTMIVRDEEHNLPICLDSVRGIFDEIIVVDTGSTDRTVEIARSYGARVFDFVWVADFSAARNAALARATGDYVFTLDADEFLEAAEQTKLRDLLSNLCEPTAGYVVRCVCDPGHDGVARVLDRVRLFPNREDIRWDYRVHEQILPALGRARVATRRTSLKVRHTGFADQDSRLSKSKRNRDILDAELSDRPGDPLILCNLGFVALERSALKDALVNFRRASAASSPSDPIAEKLRVLISQVRSVLCESENATPAPGQPSAELTLESTGISPYWGDV